MPLIAAGLARRTISRNRWGRGCKWRSRMPREYVSPARQAHVGTTSANRDEAHAPAGLTPTSNR